jgi:hypothetical protein
VDLSATETVKIVPSECDKLLDRAEKTIQNIDKIIAKHSGKISKIVGDLAVAPRSELCRFCPSRPMCESYLDELEKWMVPDYDEDLYDVVGELVELIGDSVPSNSTGVTLDPTNDHFCHMVIKGKDGTEWVVNGIHVQEYDGQSWNPSKRNADILKMKVGDFVGVFNVGRMHDSKTEFRAYKTTHRALLKL